MLKRILVNRNKLASNRKHNRKEPAISVKTYKGTTYCMEAIIDGPVRLVYRPGKPLSCGAEVWIEAEGDVRCIGGANDSRGR